MITRYNKFRAHMVGNGFMWQDISEALGISPNGCLLACQREIIKSKYHAKLLELGFPKDVLPIPREKGYKTAHNFQITQVAT